MTKPLMNWTLQEFNQAPKAVLEESLTYCCGSTRWVQEMIGKRPFKHTEQILITAREVWDGLPEDSWLEAFAHHPQIGDLDSLRKKFAATASWAAEEQSGTASADEKTIEALAVANRRYLQKFGYIFIICATGKSASEMLDALNQRIANNPREEILLAASEQAMITQLRLKKLLK